MSDGLFSRRKLLDDFLIKGGVAAAAAGIPHLGLYAQESAFTPTGEEVLGPFYKKGAPNVRVLRQPTDPGLPLRVLGKVVDPNGEPLSNATVELWHADFYGLYDLEGFRYRARLQPDRSGSMA